MLMMTVAYCTTLIIFWVRALFLLMVSLAQTIEQTDLVADLVSGRESLSTQAATVSNTEAKG